MLAPAQPLEFGPTTTSQLLLTGRGQLKGFAVKESMGLVGASINVRDGTTGTALLILPVTLTAGASAREYFSDFGVPRRTGRTGRWWPAPSRGPCGPSPRNWPKQAQGLIAYGVGPQQSGYSRVVDQADLDPVALKTTAEVLTRMAEGEGIIMEFLSRRN